jgi:hypothetical protein
MSSRKDFFFRQRVSEAELDSAFADLEDADHNLATDIGLWGIITGAVPTAHVPVPDLTIDLTAPARAYDHLGQRIFVATGQRVDCAVDASGNPTAVSAARKERWLGVFLKFDRLLSDPRTDGNSQQVYFRRDESFALLVRQGPQADTGAASKVALADNELLVCDILRRSGQTQILPADIDTSRRQAFVFARSDAVGVDSALWSALSKTAPTVQAVLDSADKLLTGHFAGSTQRHPAKDIPYSGHGFATGETVQAAIDRMVDVLSSNAASTPGAAKIGADAVSGSPRALDAGSVDTQLSQIVDWINTHLSAPASAHKASSIAAAVHNYLLATNVQAQLEEIVRTLVTAAAPAPGASRIGAAATSGDPASLAEGTVHSQLSDLLAALNTHCKATSGAHPATAVSLQDSDDNLGVTDLESALAAILSFLKVDHFGARDSKPGYHRTIHQPRIFGDYVLVWISEGVGSIGTILRVYIDAQYVWFTVNASRDGTNWVRDHNGYRCGGFRFAGWLFEVLNEDSGAHTFTNWSRVWKLDFAGDSTSAFVVTGSIKEIGRLGYEVTNSFNQARQLMVGGSVCFRSRFAATPSSITFTKINASDPQVPTPLLYMADRDGFGFYTNPIVSAGNMACWFGTYTATA